MAEAAYTVASDSETSREEKFSSTFPETTIGIDIGTSQCKVAVWNGSQVEILKNSRKPEDDEFLSLVENVWRSTTPEEVLAIFLVELREMAERQLKRPIKNAVLTIPVSFSSRFQLTRIERACAMAGLHILRLMPEPTAVALLYTLYTKQIGYQSTDRNVLIFNMGAGYCDVALSVTAEEAPRGISQTIALTGSAIGGEDLLQNMMRHLLPNAENLLTSNVVDQIKSQGLLRVATQNAIHSLSSQTSVQIDVDLGNGIKICKVVDQEEFEEVNRAVFDKCASLIIQCLHDAKEYM
ncbi:hypothetical protein M0R45_020538 [Rubus argutus]|uniref:Uncharacterized protein n=1 Tax=Rubus argutus TaxID=59490 RepID=A0AAW1X8N4_RUBAR